MIQMKHRIERICIASAAATAALGLVPVQNAWAISGDIKIETTKSVYDKGDVAEFEVTIKTSDGANFLLQTNMEWSNGLSLQSVTGDNIQYNRGKIIGTTPQSEFVITVMMKVNAAEDQTITFTDTKMGSVDGSPNHTIDKKQKTIDVKEPVVETQPTEPKPTEPAPTEPTPTTPPTEPSTPTEPTTPAYKSWKATVKVDDQLNIRKGPGLNYEVVGKYTDGAKVVVTDEKKVGDITWLQVEKGWISKDYVVEGHIEKTDEEIEKEQQEQIKNEAENAENENQSNNDAAQKKDEEKKEQYDKQEQAQQSTNITTAEDEVETKENQDETLSTETTEGAIGSFENAEIATQTVTTIDGVSYARYQTDRMQKPFYLYLESYSLQFPTDYEKTSLMLGGLDFLMAIPADVSMRKPNVYLAYGSYDINSEPALYYFDIDSDAFFPYEKMVSKTVIIDKTIEYEQKPITKSHVLIGLFAALGLYAVGAVTTAFRYRKKEKKAIEDATPPTVKVTKPNLSPSAMHTAEEVLSMDDAELEQLLKLYGASSEDIAKNESKKSTPKKVAAPQPKPASKEMKWDTLARLMEHPEDIEEAPAKQMPPVEIVPQTKDTDDIVKEISDNINGENVDTASQEIEEKLKEAELLLDNSEPVEELATSAIDINVAPINPAAAVDMDEIPDMYLKFEQIVEEDRLDESKLHDDGEEK